MLSGLLVASLSEDTYGLAQQEVPRIAEAFVRHLQAFESLFRELSTADDAETKAAVAELVQPIIAADHTALTKLALAFEPCASTPARV